MKSKSKVFYDERRKVLTHEVEMVEEAHSSDGKIIGEVTTKTIGVYKGEKAITNIYSGLNNDVEEFERSVERKKDDLKDFDRSNNKLLKELKKIEEDEEVKKLKESMEKIQKLGQKVKIETQRETIVEEISNLEERLRYAKRNRTDIKSAIGSRLKL